MIEQGIYFALGCIVTALLSLLFAPVFWRRALRLTRQRLALQVPLSMQEILAQRDQIRAEFAVERVRLEQAMEAVQETKGADMAEIGRQSMVAAKLGEDVAVLRQAEQTLQADIEHLRSQLPDTTSGDASPAPEPNAQASVPRPVAEPPVEPDERLQIQLDSLRATVAALTTRGMGLEARLKDAEKGAASKETEASLRARLETAREHFVQHEAAATSLRRELDEAKTHIRKLEQDVKAATSAPRDASESEGPPRAPEKIELLAAENAALRSALAAARQDTEAGGAADDAGLRETIHALGLAVAKLTRQARTAQENSTKLAKEPPTHALSVG